MGGREVLLPWDTILVGLGLVLERNNPKQGWRMAGSHFRCQQQTSGRSWGFQLRRLLCSQTGHPNPPFPQPIFPGILWSALHFPELSRSG